MKDLVGGSSAGEGFLMCARVCSVSWPAEEPCFGALLRSPGSIGRGGLSRRKWPESAVAECRQPPFLLEAEEASGIEVPVVVFTCFGQLHHCSPAWPKGWP